MVRDFRRFLIVRTDRIGDVILTLPMARVLRDHYPQAHIAMLIRPYTAELVEDDPVVDQILLHDDEKQPASFMSLVSSLRADRFDVVFHTHPRFRLALLTWWAGIPVRVGTGYRWYSFLFNKKVFEHRRDAKRHELEYNLNLLQAVGCDPGELHVAPSLAVHPRRLGEVKAMLAEAGIGADDRIVILHPGSGGSAREWSPDHFGALGNRLSGIPGVKIVVVGLKSEEARIERVRSAAGTSAAALVNRLTIGQYAALSKLSSLLISNSTGPIHIASAVGTPVIGLYSQIVPLSAARWGPYTDKKTIFTPKDKSPDCRTCLGSRDGSCECMDSISVDEVYRGALPYLGVQ